MKRSTFIFIGMLLTVLAIGVASCKYVPAGLVMNEPSEQGASLDKSAFENAIANTMVVNYSSQTKPVSIQHIGHDWKFDVHEVKYNGKTLLVISDYKTGLAIYDMTEPKQLTSMAEPSKESVATLSNPEVRPVPVGSEEAFIEYHTQVSWLTKVRKYKFGSVKSIYYL